MMAWINEVFCRTDLAERRKKVKGRLWVVFKYYFDRYTFLLFVATIYY